MVLVDRQGSGQTYVKASEWLCVGKVEVPEVKGEPTPEQLSNAELWGVEVLAWSDWSWEKDFPEEGMWLAFRRKCEGE